MYTLATTPQSNGKLLTRGLKLYFSSFKQVYGLALLFSLIIFIPQFIAYYQGLNVINLTRSLALYNLLFFFAEFCAIFVFTALLWRIRCVVTNQHESIFDDFKIASQKIVLILGASLFYLVFLVLIIFFFIWLPAKNFTGVPSSLTLNTAIVFLILYFIISIYVFYLLIFSLPLILTENKHIFAALSKSIFLVWGNWWKVFGLQIIPLLCYVFLIAIIQDIFNISLTIDMTVPFDFKIFFIMLFSIFFGALFVSFQGALLLLQLRDLEIRKQYE